jgi:nitrogen fixation protein FixH
MSGTLPTLFGGLAAVIFLFVILGRLPDQLRGLAAAGLPLLGYFFYIVGRWPGLDVVAIHIAVFASAAFVMVMLGRYRSRTSGKMHWAPKAFIVFFLLLAVLMASFLYIANQGLPPGIAALVLPGADKATVRTGFSGVLAHGEEAAKTVNSQLSAQYKQGQLGWIVALQGLNSPIKGGNKVIAEASDADGNALPSLTAILHVKRPGEAGEGTPFVMAQSSGGNYEGRLLLPDSGRWLVSLTLTRGDDRYRQEWEVQVP